GAVVYPLDMRIVRWQIANQNKMLAGEERQLVQDALAAPRLFEIQCACGVTHSDAQRNVQKQSQDRQAAEEPAKSQATELKKANVAHREHDAGKDHAGGGGQIMRPGPNKGEKRGGGAHQRSEGQTEFPSAEQEPRPRDDPQQLKPQIENAARNLRIEHGPKILRGALVEVARPDVEETIELQVVLGNWSARRLPNE